MMGSSKKAWLYLNEEHEGSCQQRLVVCTNICDNKLEMTGRVDDELIDLKVTAIGLYYFTVLRKGNRKWMDREE